MTDMEKVISGLTHCAEDGCKGCPYETDCNMCDGFSVLANDALELIQAQKKELDALKEAQEQRRRLQVHNVGDVDKPDWMTFEQFCEMMSNVVDALERTERGESWPYNDGEMKQNDA